MARTRNLKPGFFVNESLADLEPLTRILFQGLWGIADRDGRLEDRPRRIKAEVLPYDEWDANKALDDLHRAGFVQRYGDGKYIQILAFGEHQRPHKDEKSRGFPEPPDVSTEKNLHCTENAGCAPPLTLNPSSLHLNPSALVCSELDEPATEPAATTGEMSEFVFPVSGNKRVKAWGLTSERLTAYQETFPELDVALELRKALLWIESNPRKKKTAGGMPAFLTSWLGRSQNQGNGNRGSPGPQQPRPRVELPEVTQEELDQWKLQS